MKIRVLYHASCFDGFCAAWVAKKALCPQGDIKFIPVQYNQPLPDDLNGAVVYVLDFSYKHEEMIQLCNIAEFVICLDHHASAEKELQGLNRRDLQITFDMTKSGARLTWEHLNRFGLIPPWQVQYTEDRDLWKWELPNSREINDGLRTYPMDFDVWDKLTEHDCMEAGIILSRYLKTVVEGALEHAFPVTIAGLSVMVANCTMRDVISDLAQQLSMKSDSKIGGTFFYHKDGYYVYSLRTCSDEIDLSEVAAFFGGGGHPKAAGFKSDVLL